MANNIYTSFWFDIFLYLKIYQDKNILMSFLEIFINDYLIKQSENNIFTEKVKVNDIWNPNNNIVNKYNKYLDNIAEISRLKYSLENMLIPKSKKLIKELMVKSRSSNSDDKKQISGIKSEMFVLNSKISSTENFILELEKYDKTVLDKWNEYVELGKRFLEINNIDKEITVNDILTDEKLLTKCESQLEIYVSNKDFYNYKTILDIKNYFDISKEPEQIIKKLNKVDYMLNIENEPLELGDQNFIILMEEIPQSENIFYIG